MDEPKRHPPRVETSRDQFMLLSLVIADPRLRVKELTYTKRRKATGRYRFLVRTFTETDAAGGAIPLIQTRPGIIPRPDTA